MNLTPHFTLEELTAIETAERTLQRAYRTQYCLLASYDATTRDSEKGVLKYSILAVYYCPYQM
jgi:hypothetical protein